MSNDLDLENLKILCEKALKSGKPIVINRDLLNAVPFKYEIQKFYRIDGVLKNAPLNAIISSMMGHGTSYLFKDLLMKEKIDLTKFGFMASIAIFILYSILMYKDYAEYNKRYVTIKIIKTQE